jgi:tetratricopeptide (TPR) repeat protein
MRWSERVRRIARTRLGQLAGAIVAAWLILFVLPRLYHLLLPVNSEFLFQEARRIAESVQPAGNRAMAMAHIARALVHAGQVNRARRFAAQAPLDGQLFALHEMGHALLDQNRLDDALELARDIHRRFGSFHASNAMISSDSLFQRLAKALLAAGRHQEALEVVQMSNQITNSCSRIRRLFPLTARVQVNRMWEACFGRGIVETSDNFGTQGAYPTHPELLDWLAVEFPNGAVEFMERGWSMKAIYRLIVTSATYRQSSRIPPELLERDPKNTLYARGPRHRLEAELIRDNALAIGGLLSRKIGGPSVFPYQPEGVWDIPYNVDRWVMSEGEDRYRRGIYTFWRRSAPYPSFVAFDANSREVCTVNRPRTNTPLQALVLLNDPVYIEAAQGLAKRMLKASRGSVEKGIEYGFRCCTARYPQPKELARLKQLYERMLERYRSDPQATRKLTGKDDPAFAALTMVAHVMLNLDETITKE